MDGGPRSTGATLRDSAAVVRELRWRYRRAYRALPRSARTPLGYARRILTRPFEAAAEATETVRLYGAPARAQGGGSLARQWARLWWARTVYGVEPSLYYAMRCFEADRRALVPRLIRHRESRRLLRIVVRDARGRARVSGDADVFDDKAAFARWAGQHGIPTPTVYVAVAKGRVVKGSAAAIPRADVISKPNAGTSGYGVRRWRYDAALDRHAAATAAGGALLTREELVVELERESLAERGRLAGVLVQGVLATHPDTRALTAGALPTARVVTLRWPDGQVSVLLAIYRMPVGTADVDNFDSGGVAAPIDLATGRLGRGVVKDPSRLSAAVREHPDTGAPIEGATLPHWPATLELAHRAHRASPVPFPVLGWDVALTPNGPMLVEGNASPSATLAQTATGTPLGDTAFAPCLLAYLRDIPGAWRSASGARAGA